MSFWPAVGPGSRALLSQSLLCNPIECQHFVPFSWADTGTGLAGDGLAGAACLWHRLLSAALAETGCFMHWLAEVPVSRCWSISSLAMRADKDQLRSRC